MMRTRGVRAGVAVAIGLTGLLSVACSSTITADGAEKSVAEVVSRETDFTPDDVKCPDGIKAEEGVTFDCHFTGPDGDYVAHVTVDKIAGDNVLFNVETELDE